ncbi:uncharacterized protein CELE_F20D12.12 [Caenorhabditis elegans]|uniref:Uncharacterized protein n=1 Tax=Caenorhabditis elegans TaxID=6239 RepID=W6RQZ9_CAEEL|nr:Uncharacterized protein CELE_F20D12.12 [Caenorhabditis elegans]CDM63525.1 Uncharacterized protein CELE_F20D12.12 [Caenorhabditis elegans]|eukprot:NP_001294169.1 Uncharacterized protein CELE_F20D12.12 [Caenorhabditis elegans]
MKQGCASPGHPHPPELLILQILPFS